MSLDVVSYDGVLFDWNKVTVRDVLVQGALIWELHRSYSLQNEALRRGFEGKDEKLLKESIQAHGYDVSGRDWKKWIAKMPAHYVGPYGEGDVEILFPVNDSQWDQAKAENLTQVLNLEAKVLVLLLKMRQRGVALDFDQLDRVEKMALDEENRILKEIFDATGVNIGLNNCMNAGKCAAALEAVGISVPICENGQPSITTEILSHIEHPVADKIRKLRQANKIRKTFVASMRRYETNGRIHTTFRQIVGANDKNETSGAAFGRLSSVDPNAQQQPSRGKFAKPWRKIWVPEPGCKWLSADYSSVEPRWTIHFAELLGLPGAKELANEYRTNPRIDPHGAMAKIVYGPNYTEDERKEGKVIVLGTTYGMSGAKLCTHHLHLPTRWLVQHGHNKKYFQTRKEAVQYRMKQVVSGKCEIREVAGEQGQIIQDKFHAGAPFIRLLVRKVIEKAAATGTLRLLGGRVIHFPLNERDGTYDWTYKAPNRLVQGNAGMHLKIAMLAIEDEFPGFLAMTVHDEVCGSCPDIVTAKRIGDIMENAVKALVPFRVDLEYGPSWGEQSLICKVPGCTNFADPVEKYGCHRHQAA
jgi:DNA polymerase I-like protein with 3'-5' exonuclease and polymerase domains